MNEPFDELENELRRLKPSPTGEALDWRVAEAVGSEETAVGSGRVVVPAVWAWRLTLAAAAAVVMLLACIHAMREAPSAAPESEGTAGAAFPPSGPEVKRVAANDGGLRRVRHAHYVLDAADEGWVAEGTAGPARQVRWQYLSASEWRDDRAGTTFQVLVPREETMVIPVEVY